MNKKEHKANIEELFHRFLINACKPEEVRILMEYTDTADEVHLRMLVEQQFHKEATKEVDQDTRLILQQVYKRIDLKSTSVTPFRRVISLRKWIPYVAAMLILTLSISLYFLKTGNDSRLVKEETEKNQLITDVMPGSNKAILTLADGRTINLSSDHDGIILVEDGVTYFDGSKVNTQTSEQMNLHQKAAVYNTITTPRGGQYQIKLPDGTMVWLNAASTLRYPNRFTGDFRQVELEGEAYFDVAKIFISNTSMNSSNKIAQPFIVKTANQEITVLGTEFNVSAYSNEEESKTTLVEGKLKIKVPKTQQSVHLTSGIEAISNGKNIQVRKADIESAIDWKTGDFVFNDADIQSVMRKLIRWYDVEVKFDGDIPDEKLTGQISRNKNLSEVIAVLKLSGGGNYKIKNKILYVDWKKNPS